MATANPFFLKQTQFKKVGFPPDVMKCIGEYLMKHEQRAPTPTAAIIYNAFSFARDKRRTVDYWQERFPTGCHVITRYDYRNDFRLPTEWRVNRIYLRMSEQVQQRWCWYGEVESDDDRVRNIPMYRLVRLYYM